MSTQDTRKPNPTKRNSRIPENSLLFERIVPAALVFMGILTVLLILLAAGVLLGIVQF